MPLRHWSPPLLACTLLTSSFSPLSVAPPAAPIVAFNDNITPAGTMNAGELQVALVAAPGDWRPYGPARPSLTIPVFGEAGKPLQDPGPMIRVPVGTRVRVAIRNRTSSRIVVHGLSSRLKPVMDSLIIAPGSSGIAQFIADVEGTFYYWASTHGEDLTHRALDDGHLSGALIVDPAGPARAPNDRVFVMERITSDTTADGLGNFAHDLFTINGRPWPGSERLTYDMGDSVHWRIINASSDVHPLHLHGFYYQVNARGDLAHDTIYTLQQRRSAVTEAMLDGTTMDMAWQPDRPGGWVFHCHLNQHVSQNAALLPDTESTPARNAHLRSGYPDQHAENHAESAMGGLVLGITVRAKAGWQPYTGPRRDLRLLVQSDSSPRDTVRMFGYVLQDGHSVPRPDSVTFPGPPLILHRGEPTRIWVVNHLAVMTQVHWHGIELESFYDGVAGLSGTAPVLAPPIMPGDSFEVLMTPPRAGTFIYHTHINDINQQLHGLYGPLIVLDSGVAWTPATDRVFILGSSPTRVMLNGSAAPQPVTFTVGVPYRFRLINITIGSPLVQFVLARGGAPVSWTPLAKDGKALPPWQRAPVAARRNVSIGETYDFMVQVADTGAVALEVHRGNGTILVQQAIRFVR